MADFQSRLADLEKLGAAVVAASVDSEADTRQLIEKLQVTFPVAYGIDGRRVCEATGAYWEERRSIVHATGFLLRPDGRIVHAVYSTGPVGRFVAADLNRQIEFQQKAAAAPKS